jgi:ATP-binding cassette subfamily C (CFTR/MRP) protein 2
MKPEPGHFPRIGINGSVAFVAQKSWIMNCSIEDNILMTLPKDQKRFDEAVHYSCLESDIKSLPDGHSTMVGEKGITISGGQKTRLSLARALYSDKDIYLFDDIISAVDVHVGNFIVKETVLNYLQQKTRVLVTHAITYAKYADSVIVMRKGEVVEQGSYEQVKQSPYFQ